MHQLHAWVPTRSMDRVELLAAQDINAPASTISGVRKTRAVVYQEALTKKYGDLTLGPVTDYEAQQLWVHQMRNIPNLFNVTTRAVVWSTDIQDQGEHRTRILPIGCEP